ncbi:MAG: phytanoyl-CoA dioxygenase family protein [Planctomycetota bacterium]|nr:phytanoyl-CoA dioxygenase family protein [Planctomycetota bacterium]
MSIPFTFDRPFPALTPAQRYHFDLHGYVVVPGVLSADEVGTMLDALRRLRAKLLELGDPTGKGPRVNQAYLLDNRPHHRFMANIIEADPVVTAYATHPRLVAMCEEVMGCEARIVEMNAHLNSRDPEWSKDPVPKFGFHRGTDIPFGTHSMNGLFHCSFVKTLTNLTELGPDDGGTVVVAGSHKIDVPEADLVACAYEDRSLIHQVVAPAGSTLLFPETLIHATGQIRSDRERCIIITGYGPTLFPYWDDGSLSPGFKERIPESLRPLFHGKAHWTRGPRYRRLNEPVDARPFPLGRWDDRQPPAKKP